MDYEVLNQFKGNIKVFLILRTFNTDEKGKYLSNNQIRFQIYGVKVRGKNLELPNSLILDYWLGNNSNSSKCTIFSNMIGAKLDLVGKTINNSDVVCTYGIWPDKLGTYSLSRQAIFTPLGNSWPIYIGYKVVAGAPGNVKIAGDTFNLGSHSASGKFVGNVIPYINCNWYQWDQSEKNCYVDIHSKNNVRFTKSYINWGVASQKNNENTVNNVIEQKRHGGYIAHNRASVPITEHRAPNIWVTTSDSWMLSNAITLPFDFRLPNIYDFSYTKDADNYNQILISADVSNVESNEIFNAYWQNKFIGKYTSSTLKDISVPVDKNTNKSYELKVARINDGITGYSNLIGTYKVTINMIQYPINLHVNVAGNVCEFTASFVDPDVRGISWRFSYTLKGAVSDVTVVLRNETSETNTWSGTIPGLKSGATYTFQVDAVATVNNMRSYSNTIDTYILSGAYVYTDNSMAKRATVFVKTNTGWKPATPYIKTQSGWKPCV